MSSFEVRRGRDQRQHDPYELPVHSDFSSDESIKEEKLRPVLRPRSPPQEQEDSSSPILSGRSHKRRRLELASDAVEPLENYLYFEARSPSPTCENAHEETQASKPARSDDVTSVKPRIYPTIWDVMAGRVNRQGFIPSTPFYAASRDVPSSSTKPVNLRGYLLRNAPKSLQSADHQYLSQSTPAIQDAKPKDDDLLRALHVYVSEFYAHLPGGEINFQSMDASALIAMAVLLEETMEAKVGEDGWRALMEGENSLDEFGQPVKKFFDTKSWQWQPSVLAAEDYDESERPRSATEHTTSVRSTLSRGAPSIEPAQSDTKMMDISDSQDDQDSEARSTGPRSVTDDYESVEMSRGLEVNTETKSSDEDEIEEQESSESDSRPAARKTGSGEMPAWLKRAIESDEEEDEGEESEDGDSDEEHE